MCVAPISTVDLPLSEFITVELDRLGMQKNTKGYQFTFYAIELYLTHNDMFYSLTKSVYPAIANEYSTSTQSVERLMRYTIENTFEYGDLDAIYELFGNLISENKGKVTNGCFIKTIANKILKSYR